MFLSQLFNLKLKEIFADYLVIIGATTLLDGKDKLSKNTFFVKKVISASANFKVFQNIKLKKLVKIKIKSSIEFERKNFLNCELLLVSKRLQPITIS